MDHRKPDLDLPEMARSHRRPPPVPRDRMWARIDAARTERRQVLRPGFARRPQPVWRFVRLAAGLAAVLMVGVFIGRISDEPAPAPGPQAAAGLRTEVRAGAINTDTQGQVYRLAAADLFGRADYLLTDLNVRACTATDLSAVPDWAGGMLVQTRLLMDTAVAEDPETRALLEELELVLAQIVGVSRDHCARDMAWIRRGLQERSTLDRLRMMSAGGQI
jgi:hypothetical protein